MVLIYITCRDREEARKISRHLLGKKLIACSNIHPIESMYWWEGKIQEDSEFVMIAKTDEKSYEKAREEAKKMHSYDIPCILKIDAEADEEYGKWADSCLDSNQA